MIKIVALVARNPTLSKQEFRRYWEDVHVPLMKKTLPGLVKYTGGFPLKAEDEIDPATEIGGYDLVIELGFPDIETMQRDFTSEAYLAPERVSSASKFMNMSLVRHILVEEVDVI